LGRTAIILGGGLGGIATISARILRVSGDSGNDHCLHSGFQRAPGIFFNRVSSASPKRVNETYTLPFSLCSILSVAIRMAPAMRYNEHAKTCQVSKDLTGLGVSIHERKPIIRNSSGNPHIQNP
jgi:hypothetical protein